VRNFTFFRHSLVERPPPGEDGAKWRPTARLTAVAGFIAGVAREGRTLVVTNKRVRCALTGEKAGVKLPISGQYADADIAHFGNIRGTNEFEDHEVVIVLGREQPSPRDAERLAMAIWYDTKRPIRCIEADAKGQVQYPRAWRTYDIRDGSQPQVTVRGPPRPPRPLGGGAGPGGRDAPGHWPAPAIHSARKKTVYILCNIPLDLPVDELVTWRELVGDDRLAEALEICDENGWDALPLAGKELTRLFPELWRTRKAAEDWARKDPLTSIISIIRVWGVLNTYRPPGQTSWSKAVVRHGADPRQAFAAVLGVAAEDIRVRECPE
jgi:hypothetical protein